MTTHFQHLAALAAATLAITLASPAAAQVATGGSANLSTGNGFGCAGSATYQMVNGVARCTQPTATVVTASACAAATLTRGACAFSFPATTSGSTPAVSSLTAGYTGSAQATCSNGNWTGLSGSCDPNPCTAATATYGACSFSFPSTASGTSPSVSTSTTGYTGTGQATCTAGSWGSLSATCAPSNCGGTVTTYGSCSYSVPALASGASTSVTTSTSGYGGSVTASCSIGSLTFSGQSCAIVRPPPPPPSPCSSGTVSWGGGCNASITATASGSNSTVTNAASGYSGSETLACSNGIWSAVSGNCTPLPCAAGTISWSTSCSGSIPATASGYSATVTNAVAGYTGSASFTCATGTWGAMTSASCASSAPPLAACPANIWIRTNNISLPLSNPNPSNKLPNGNAYCLYELKPPAVGDRMAGVFDRVKGQAVDFFPIFQEYPDWTGNTANSTMAFTGYEPRYSSNLHIQGAYCANNTSDPNQSGFYPGTCENNGAGGFGPMCFVQLNPGSSLGSYMLANGFGNRLVDGGSEKWGAYVWATRWVDDGTNSWSEGGGYSLAYGWYTGGLHGRCIISNPQNEVPTAVLDNPPPTN